MFEIMFNDLKPDAQKEFLKYMGIKNPSEGNYEFVPIATIDYNDDDGEEDANESICLKEGDYEEDTDGCLLVKGLGFFFDELVDISFEGNPNHYTRYLVRADNGRLGEAILEPTGYEYDEENEDETVTSREIDCPCDCSDCEHADKCTENGRYDFSDDEEKGGE